MAAGFVLWQVYTSIVNRNKEDKSKIKNQEKKDEQVLKEDEAKSNRYEKMLDDINNRQDEFYKLLISKQEDSEKRYEKMLDEMIEMAKKPHVLTSEENQRMTKIDEEIDDFLEKTLIACDASRVCLVKYHNGGNDMLGNSILKMSMSNEKCAAGVIHTMSSFQNQLRSFSTFLMKELNEKGICFIEDVENLKSIDNSLYQYLKQIGIKAKYSIAIRNTKTNVVIGYFSIEYANNEHINIEQVKQCLKDKRLKIETLLNL